MGIWEDNVNSLNALFEGRIDPNSSEQDEDNGYVLPWNHEITKFGDFDNPLDIKKINKKLFEEYISLTDEMVINEIEYIKENGVDVNY